MRTKLVSLSIVCKFNLLVFTREPHNKFNSIKSDYKKYFKTIYRVCCKLYIFIPYFC